MSLIIVSVQLKGKISGRRMGSGKILMGEMPVLINSLLRMDTHLLAVYFLFRYTLLEEEGNNHGL